MNTDDLEILKHMMNGATPPEFAIRLLEDICSRTNLSWKARHVYLQKRKSKNGGDSWQAVLSIDGFRAVGARHPDYAGQEGPLYVVSSDGAWTDIPTEGPPYAAKVGIRKKTGLTTWGTAKYKDYYAGMMWDKFPSTMVAKCAEMLAWRKTFPETFGGLYGDEELQQMAPKNALQASEVLAEAPVPRDAPNPSSREAYAFKLKNATSLEEVVAIGKDIKEDRTLETQSVMELHQMYTKRKKELG